MNIQEQAYFDEQYRRHLRALKLQGKSEATIDSYGRAVRRVAKCFDCSPDKLNIEQLTGYFAELVESHSWSTVKIDRNGLQFFWKHVLHRSWQWLDIIKAPKIYSLPDILTLAEVEQLIAVTYNLRYKVFMLATYSMGLRLAETLHLQVGDIDADRQLVHIRRGKGHKDRFVPLPDFTCSALRHLWCQHRNPVWLFPCGTGSMETIRRACSPMDRGGAQAAMKSALADCGIKKKPPFTPSVIVSPLIF